MNIFSIVPDASCFSHEEAMAVYELASKLPPHRNIEIDLSRARDATTSGFARLVLLRKNLRAEGRELHLINLQDRVARLHAVNRLATILPHRTTPN